eukprot:358854-Chlamydomonas_euryale.AAC.3
MAQQRTCMAVRGDNGVLRRAVWTKGCYVGQWGDKAVLRRAVWTKGMLCRAVWTRGCYVGQCGQGSAMSGNGDKG